MRKESLKAKPDVLFCEILLFWFELPDALLCGRCYPGAKLIVISRCGFISPHRWHVCGFDVKDLAEFFILRIPSVNSDKHHLLFEILGNSLNCLRRSPIGKKYEMLVPIVAKDRLPVVQLELNDMGGRVKRHKIHQSSQFQLAVKNPLNGCKVNQNPGGMISHLAVEMLCPDPDGVPHRPALEVAQHSKTNSRVKEVTCLRIVVIFVATVV